MAKLPLDRYLEWGAGSGKSLTLNQVMSIMLDMKVSGDWNHALRHVPRRKLADFTQKIAARKVEQQIGVHNGSIQNMYSSWKPKAGGGQPGPLTYRKPARHVDSEPEDVRRVPEVRRVSATELLLNYNRGIKK